MTSRNIILSISSILFLVLAGCGGDPQSPQLTPDVKNAASTIVALTFQAATASASHPGIANTPKVAIATPTTKPTLFINGNISCRTGTGPNFKVLATFTPGTTLDMVARDSVDSAWLVTVPNSNQTCWILVQDASPSGSYINLQDITPQPSSQKLPTVPGSIFYSFSCTHPNALSTVTTNLSWTDTAGDANGFRVYRSGTQIADLPPDTPSFTDTTTVIFASPLTYSVVAYNDVGASPGRTVNFTCK